MTRKNFLGPITMTVAAALLAGCGSSAYEANFQATLTQQRNEAPFRDLFTSNVPLPETNLTLRLPKLFSEQCYALDELTLADPRKLSRPLDAYRVQPDFLPLAGHVRTYERFVLSPYFRGLNRQLPFYCYVAVTDTSAGSDENLRLDLRNKLVAAFGELDADEPQEEPKGRAAKKAKKGVGEWEAIEVPTPNGSTLQAHKIVAYGEQSIHYYEKDDQVKELLRPGVYVLYVYSTGQQHVLIGWRATPDVAEAIKMEELAAATLGTITLQEVAAAAQN